MHEEFKRRIKTQTVLPSAAAMLFWALLASGQITIRKVDAWRSLAENLVPKDRFYVARVRNGESALSRVLVRATFIQKPSTALSEGRIRNIAITSIQEASCEIDDSKKRVIKAVLCGQMAAESQYHFSGSDCLANSARKHFEDSAVQILGYNICGEREFSDRLKEANLKALKFVEILSVCTSERPNFAKIMDEAVSLTAQRAAGVSCTADLRARLTQRRAYFERFIADSNDPNFLSSIFEKLDITVDTSGNIRAR